MKSRKYKNFDEALYELSREVLYNPYEMIDYTNSHTAFIEDIVLTIQNVDCSIDIGEFGYRKNKWTLVTKSCVDKKKMKKFYDKLKTTKYDACVYMFPDDDAIPLLSIMLTRHDERQKWKKCVVYMKQVDVQRTLAVYMVFLFIFIRKLPDCCNIKEVTIHIGEGSICSYFVNGLLEYYDTGLEELDISHPFIKDCCSIKNTLFKNKNQLSKYQTVRTMQQMKFGMYKTSEIRALDLDLGV